MYKVVLGFGAALLLFAMLTHKYVPNFEQAHNAFVCNYLGTVCRDKMSVLPVAWQRYTP
jgi:hypothetical protein